MDECEMRNLSEAKIAYVSTYYPQRCGIAAYTSFLVGGIRKVSPKTHVRIIAEREALALKEEFFEVVPCWSREENYVEQILTNLDNVDILHIQHEYSIYKFDDRLPTLLQKTPQRIRKVLTIHCVRPAQVSERWKIDEEYAGKIAKLADHIIVHLESQKEILLRLGLTPERISVIPHGTKIIEVDREASRRRLGLPLDGKILLMFGFVKPHKCLHVAVDALNIIRKKYENAYLFIAGGLAPTASEEHRCYADSLRKKIEELNLEENVIFPNKYYPDEDVPYIFSACDIVLFPYYEEDRSSSGSLHLAIGAGKPVIASRIPKFEELKHISDELLVLPYNSEVIAKLALRIFKEPNFRDHIIGRTEAYRKLTSWENTARKHLELYSRLIEI
ncbi:glycosyltransferase family 4 protein [Candidatus Bathyarchaeota archaeon]|nr:glycosyltransferase family 4 protein [Candidatus Bathyarchaeota archaeon]